jgi:hypothetical protein
MRFHSNADLLVLIQRQRRVRLEHAVFVHGFDDNRHGFTPFFNA